MTIPLILVHIHNNEVCFKLYKLSIRVKHPCVFKTVWNID